MEIAHIIPWSRRRTHDFPNLIALCPTCHTRYDNHQIDRKSMLAYKRNAWLQSSRYSDLEKRLLLAFVRTGETEAWLFGGLELLLSELLGEGLLVDAGGRRPGDFPATLHERLYRLTPAGEQIVAMLAALDPPDEGKRSPS